MSEETRNLDTPRAANPMQAVVRFRLREEVHDAEMALFTARRRYLEATGWTWTSDTPDHCWRMVKKCADGSLMLMGIADAVACQRALDHTESKLPYEGEAEHPEDYEGSCGCNLCVGYGV